VAVEPVDDAVTPEELPELVEPDDVPELVSEPVEPDDVPELVSEPVEPDDVPELVSEPVVPEEVVPEPVEPDEEPEAVEPEAVEPEPELAALAVPDAALVVALCAGSTTWMNTASPSVEVATPPTAALRRFRSRLTAASRLSAAVWRARA
jgi:hypothetical protein